MEYLTRVMGVKASVTSTVLAASLRLLTHYSLNKLLYLFCQRSSMADSDCVIETLHASTAASRTVCVTVCTVTDLCPPSRFAMLRYPTTAKVYTGSMAVDS